MSDQSEGPGWWFASDGKWYPPTAVPGPVPAAPIEPLVSPELCRWTARGMVATAVVALIVGGLQSVGILRFHAWWDASPGQEATARDAYTSWADLISVAERVHSAIGWLAIVVFVVWMNQAHKATSRLNPAPRRWGSGWTVGGWFVPGANLALPKIVLNEMERLTRSVRDPQAAGADWRVLSTMPSGWVWWLAWLLSGAFVGVAFVLGSPEELTRTIDATRFQAPYVVANISLVTYSISSLAAAVYVRSLSRSINGEG